MNKANDKKKRTPWKIGRPLKFQTSDEMAAAMEAYFNQTPWEELTITGLCLAIGLDRGQLLDYGGRDQFSYVVKKAKLIIENVYEVQLRKTGGSGPIFALKQFKWVDKYDVENTGTIAHEHQPVSRSHQFLEEMQQARRAQPPSGVVPN